MSDPLSSPLGDAWPKGAPEIWTPDDTQLWLTENPLPIAFVWPYRDPKPDGAVNLQEVRPKYQVADYGKWLRETPYFPGLFEEIHEILVLMGAELPEDGADLARRLEARRRARGEQAKLF